MSHKHRPFQDLEHALDARGGDPDAWGDHVEEVGRTAVAAGRAAPATPRPLEVLVAHHALGWPVFDGIHDDFPDEDPDAEGWVFRATYEDNGEEAWQSARRMNEEDGCGWVDYTELAERLNSWSGLGLVVEAMEKHGWVVSNLNGSARGGWWCHLVQRGSGNTFGDSGATPWTAAFVAALRALGVDEDTINAALEVSDA